MSLLSSVSHGFIDGFISFLTKITDFGGEDYRFLVKIMNFLAKITDFSAKITDFFIFTNVYCAY